MKQKKPVPPSPAELRAEAAVNEILRTRRIDYDDQTENGMVDFLLDPPADRATLLLNSVRGDGGRGMIVRAAVVLSCGRGGDADVDAAEGAAGGSGADRGGGPGGVPAGEPGDAGA